MKKSIDAYRVREGKRLNLKKQATKVAALYSSKKHFEKLLVEHRERLSSLQNLLYADNRYSLLLIFQAMDAAGKDSAIKHVMSGVNPQGCQVFSFKHPSAEELDHDFLWRTARCLPERGRIGIFNRSYYEEVLIVRVHPEILANQGLPPEELKHSDFWERRFQSISSFEKHLHRNGTKIVKFFLHLSKEEQRKRFLARIEDENKNWKFSRADLNERALWDEYQEAYASALSATSTSHSPWYVVPADDKPNARLIISQIIVETLEKLPLSFPKPTKQQQAELRESRALLEAEE